MAGKAKDFVSDSRKALVDRILAQMEKGELFWEQPWNADICLPHNPVSNVRYAGGNRLRLIISAMEHGYTDTRFVTFVQAVKEGWKVKKGERGILCEKWIYEKVTDIENPDTHEKEKIVVPLAHPVVSYFYVFNAAQIEGMPEQTLPVTEVTAEEQDITGMLIRASPCEVKEMLTCQAGYIPALDVILMPPKETFHTRADFIKTLLHEMVHSTGHPDRLNRNLKGKFGTPDYAKEELRAELGSLFLAADLGLPVDGKHLENHAAYLQSWIEVLRRNPDELFVAASDAEKAAGYINERYRQLVQTEKLQRQAQQAALKTPPKASI